MKICQNRFEVQARGSLEHQARWRRHWKRLKGTTGKFGGGGRSAAQFAPAQKKIQTCKSVRAAADEMCGVSIFLKAGPGSPPGEANTRGQAPPPDFHAISNKRALWLLLSAGGLKGRSRSTETPHSAGHTKRMVLEYARRPHITRGIVMSNNRCLWIKSCSYARCEVPRADGIYFLVDRRAHDQSAKIKIP